VLPFDKLIQFSIGIINKKTVGDDDESIGGELVSSIVVIWLS